MTGYASFEFQLLPPLIGQLITHIEKMESAVLDPEHLIGIPAGAQGVYLLFLIDELVYIGKTDAQSGLGKRLARHHNQIQHRRNLNSAEVSFKAVRVEVFTAMDLETELIKHFRGKGRLNWQESGFGSNDPGKERDTTKLKKGGFDESHPIDIDIRLSQELVREGEQVVSEVLASLKRNLPYVFRFQTSDESAKKPHPDLAQAKIQVPPSPTVREVIRLVLHALPSDWRAFDLKSRVVLYKGNRLAPLHALAIE